MKLDVLAFGSHPDDVELCAAGTLAKLVHAGKKVGIVDLTRGELGSRGTAEIRDQEAADSAKILGLSARENLNLGDGFFSYSPENKMEIIKVIRKYRPEVVLAQAIVDRHPDHGRGSKLVRDAVFLSGLRKIETTLDGKPQEHWRPGRIFFYIQDYSLTPDFVVDISDFFEQKMEAVKAFSSQFYNPESDEPETYISTRDFYIFLESRARNMGHMAGVSFGEGFQSETPLLIGSPLDLL